MTIKYYVAVMCIASMAASAKTYTNQDATPPYPKKLEEKLLHNNKGLVIRDEFGKKKNYTKEQLIGVETERTDLSVKKPLLTQQQSDTYLNSTSQTYAEIFRTYSYGEGIGFYGMEHVDIDSDGTDEVLMASTNGWSVQQFNKEKNSYEIIHQQPGAVSKLRLASNPSNGDPLIITVNTDGIVEIFNGFTLELSESFNANMSYVNDLVIADANNDGDDDIIITSSSETKLFDLGSHQLHVTLDRGGSAVQVGEVNADSKVELVLNTGLVYQIDGGAALEVWDYGKSFGRYIQLGNTDNDAELEVIAAEVWSHYRAVDVVEQSIIWEEENFNTGSFRLVDVAGDSLPEIIIGDSQWGNIHAHDLRTREEIWAVENPDHGVTNTVIFDGDGDGNLELYWGAGFSSSGSDHLYSFDLASFEQEWKSEDTRGPFAGNAVGDLDNDGVKELVYTSWESNSGYDDGILYVLDAETYERKFVGINLFEGQAWTGVHDVAITNVDSDEQKEILVTTDRLYDGALYVIDGLTFEVQSQFIFDDGAPLYAMELRDVDNDGIEEVITGGGKEHTGSPGVFVYAINADDGSKVWTSTSVTSTWTDVTDVHVADLNQDGAEEIIAVAEDLSIINSETGVIEDTKGGVYLSVATAQNDSDTALEIIAADAFGYINIIDGVSYEVEDTVQVCSSMINAITLLTQSNVLVTCGSEVIEYDLTTKSTVWSSDLAESNLGRLNNLEVYNHKGKNHFMLGGQANLYVFQDISGNTVPRAEEQFYSVHWRSTLEGTLLGADDNEEDSLNYILVSSTKNGEIATFDKVTGVFEFIPINDIGLEVFEYRVTDGKTMSDTATVSIDVTNTKPVATDLQLDLHWRGEQQFSLHGVDNDSDPITFKITETLARGELVLINEDDGEVSIVAPADGLESESFSYLVSDTVSESTVATATINYTNDAPISSEKTFEVNAGNILSGRLVADDPNNDPLTFRIVNGPTKGVLNLDANTGVFDYTPDSSVDDSDVFTFSATDGVSTSATASINITIHGKPVEEGDDEDVDEGNGSGGGGASSWLLIAMLLSLVFIRNKYKI